MKAVLFDLDGTIIDTTEFIFQAYEHTLKTHGFKVTKREILSPHIGRGLAIIYNEIAPGGDTEVLIETHKTFQAKNLHLVNNFQNTAEILKILKRKKIKIGIVTSRLKNTKATLAAAGLKVNLFDVIITADEVKNTKPHPEGVLLALKKLKIKPSNAILVGDAIHDIEMGKNAGVKTVGVTYGFGGEGVRDAKPDFIIDDLRELPKVLKLD